MQSDTTSSERMYYHAGAVQADSLPQVTSQHEVKC